MKFWRCPNCRKCIRFVDEDKIIVMICNKACQTEMEVIDIHVP